jgi:AraC family transcriptional regulator
MMKTIPPGRVLKAGQYYGDMFKSRDVSGVFLTEVSYPLGHWTPSHTHERAYFSLVLQGTADKGRSMSRSSDQTPSVWFHPSGMLHDEQVRRWGGLSFFIEIGPTLLQHVDGHTRLQKESIAFHGGLTNKLAARLYREFRQRDSASHIAIEGLVLEMLAQCSRDRTTSTRRNIPRWLAEAREIIHEHYSESLSLSGIAKLVQRHPVHLATEFRRFYHCSVGDYIRRLKIDNACLQLSASEVSLAQIAAGLGFSHQAHFTRTFKDYMSLTPSGYRKRFLKS